MNIYGCIRVTRISLSGQAGPWDNHTGQRTAYCFVGDGRAGVLIRKMRDTGHERIIMILVTPGFLSLAPDILYHAIWMSAVPVLIYKQSPEPLVVIVGSLIWALLMAGLTALLAKVNIRLKL